MLVGSWPLKSEIVAACLHDKHHADIIEEIPGPRKPKIERHIISECVPMESACAIIQWK